MKTCNTIRLASLVAMLSVGACASAPDLKNLPADALFQQGMASLQAEKWADAARAFERFSLEFVGHERYQESRYRLGEARFGAKEYVLAAADFARLQNDFPGGPWADDAQFKTCESYVKLSPAVQLDQEYTQEALNQCQILVAYYPASEHVAKASAYVVELTDKLANKLYYVGDYYFRRRAYDPAIMYYELAASSYPTSSFAPRALSRLIDTYRVLKYDTEEADTRARLLRDYPQSPEARALSVRPDSVTTQ
jgi:outer membrane protein assembly factor BamD